MNKITIQDVLKEMGYFICDNISYTNMLFIKKENNDKVYACVSKIILNYFDQKSIIDIINNDIQSANELIGYANQYHLSDIIINDESNVLFLKGLIEFIKTSARQKKIEKILDSLNDLLV